MAELPCVAPGVREFASRFLIKVRFSRHPRWPSKAAHTGAIHKTFLLPGISLRLQRLPVTSLSWAGIAQHAPCDEVCNILRPSPCRCLHPLPRHQLRQGCPKSPRTQYARLLYLILRCLHGQPALPGHSSTVSWQLPGFCEAPGHD